jgi:esterase/lipase
MTKETTQDKNLNGRRIATVLHDAGGKNIVIFCHGFHGTNIGPSRFFVRTARRLAERGISSLRFDQYGSGNSEGDFLDSRFSDWVKMIQTIAEDYMKNGYRVALFGQSMGGSAAIVAAAALPKLSALVAWAPDPNIDKFAGVEDEITEEGGQRVRTRFWQEAHDAHVAETFALLKAPAYIVQCTADAYVNKENRDALIKNAQPHHSVENLEGYAHAIWTYDQSEEIIEKSVRFLEEYLKGEKLD